MDRQIQEEANRQRIIDAAEVQHMEEHWRQLEEDED